MPKRRKTLKQKVHQNEKQKHSSVKPPQEKSIANYTYTLPNIPKKDFPKPSPSTPQQAYAIDTKQYSYLGNDLRKTIFLTSAVVLLEVILTFYL